MSEDSGLDYVKYIAAVAGAAIGYGLGAFIAGSMTVEVTPGNQALIESQIVGIVLQFGGAAVGAVIAYLIARAFLKG